MIQFTLTEEQESEYLLWRSALEILRPKNCYTPGGGYCFEIEPTDKGTMIKVRRDDGEFIDLTEWDNWK